MAKQIHKQFTNEQVKELLEKYINKEIERKYIQATLGIKKAQFFRLLKAFRNNPKDFSIDYERKSKTRSNKPDPHLERWGI
ncbi:MAG: hypothetical protein KAS66_13445 [Candidatus Omnitrophica bacterium]|nr:hypothetical protein [Candidatus Omnitrophota bacterium]